jgi:catechol 2,3-dioxygenase-like lactoylglutathione lyase family enzyme
MVVEEGISSMIRVRRIAHADFETPDVERQVAYYTDVLGLTLVEKGKDVAYLASTNDHHAVVLRKGAEARCTRLAFQTAPDADLNDFKKQVESHGIKVQSSSDAEPTIPQMLSFEDTKGTIMEVFREREPAPQRFGEKGIVPMKLGHVAFNVVGVKKASDFYCDVLGFRVSDWMADFFVFLRCSPDHHTINLIDSQRNKMHHIAFELRNWGHLQTADLGSGPARHRPQPVRLSPQSRRTDHRAVRRARPHQRRGPRLFRAAALAQGPAAEAEGLDQGSVGLEHLGHHAAPRFPRLTRTTPTKSIPGGNNDNASDEKVLCAGRCDAARRGRHPRVGTRRDRAQAVALRPAAACLPQMGGRLGEAGRG